MNTLYGVGATDSVSRAGFAGFGEAAATPAAGCPRQNGCERQMYSAEVFPMEIFLSKLGEFPQGRYSQEYFAWNIYKIFPDCCKK